MFKYSYKRFKDHFLVRGIVDEAYENGAWIYFVTYDPEHDITVAIRRDTLNWIHWEEIKDG